MPLENATPDLPEFDPKADRGDNFVPEGEEKQEVELTAEELEVVKGKPAEKAEEEKKNEDEAVAKGEKKEEVEEEKKPEERARDAKGKFIPKSRFDEVNNRAKAKVAALEATIDQLKQRLAPLEGEAPSDLEALEKTLEEKGKEYAALLVDGKLDEANATFKEINRLNRQIAMIETSALTSSHAQESHHVDALGQMIEMYKEAYPVFNEDQKDVYDQDLVNYVADLQARFEATGMAPAAALRESVEICVARFGLVTADEVEAAPATPAKTAADARKSAGVKKAVEAAAKQPPALHKTGMDSDKAGMSKIDVLSLTQEEFARLPESTLARLRGDFL